MTSLDYGYLDTVLNDAREGDSNAFAEIYAATYVNQYRFAMGYLGGEEFDAEDALQETYVYALTNLSQISASSMLLPWLFQVNFRICYGKKQRMPDSTLSETAPVTVKNIRTTVSRILRLPLTQSQAVIMCDICGLKVRKAAEYMDMRRSTLRSYRRAGLKALMGEEAVK